MLYYGYYVAQYTIHAPECRYTMLCNCIMPLPLGIRRPLSFALERVSRGTFVRMHRSLWLCALVAAEGIPGSGAAAPWDVHVSSPDRHWHCTSRCPTRRFCCS